MLLHKCEHLLSWDTIIQGKVSKWWCHFDVDKGTILCTLFHFFLIYFVIFLGMTFAWGWGAHVKTIGHEALQFNDVKGSFMIICLEVLHPKRIASHFWTLIF